MSDKRLQSLFEMHALNPKDSFINYAIAKEYEYLEKLDMAIDKYAEIRHIDPNYVGMYYHYGKLLWKLGRETDAILILDEGIVIAENCGDKHALGELKQLRWELSDDDM